MPYWGANVRSQNYVVQAKIHGESGSEPASDDLIELIANLTKTLNIDESKLAQFFAEKIASAFREHDYALWVTVEILTTEGRTFGETCMIKE